MNSDAIEPRQALAWMATNDNKNFDAIRWLIELHELQPDDFATVAEISRLHLVNGAIPDAGEVVEEFLATHAKHPGALKFLSRLSKGGQAGPG